MIRPAVVVYFFSSSIPPSTVAVRCIAIVAELPA